MLQVFSFILPHPTTNKNRHETALEFSEWCPVSNIVHLEHKNKITADFRGKIADSMSKKHAPMTTRHPQLKSLNSYAENKYVNYVF